MTGLQESIRHSTEILQQKGKIFLDYIRIYFRRVKRWAGMFPDAVRKFFPIFLFSKNPVKSNPAVFLQSPSPERILYLVPDHPLPSWGNGMSYHHVALLREFGFQAYVLHCKPGFLLDWLDLEVPKLYLDRSLNKSHGAGYFSHSGN